MDIQNSTDILAEILENYGEAIFICSLNTLMDYDPSKHGNFKMYMKNYFEVLLRDNKIGSIEAAKLVIDNKKVKLSK